MARRPYMNLWVGDFMGDTATLSNAEVGGYLRILMAMWNSPTGRLTMDQLRRAEGGGRNFAREWEALSPYFSTDAEGRIFQGRLLKEIAKADRVSEAKKRTKPEVPDLFDVRPNPASPSEAESRLTSDPQDIENIEGGERKRGSTRARSQHHHQESVTQRITSDSSSSTDEDEMTGKPEPTNDWPAKPMEALVAEVNSPWLDPMKSPGLITSAGMVARWKAAGFSYVDDVVPAVSGVCARARGPIHKWGYFDQAVVDAHTGRTAPLPAPSAPGAGGRFVSRADERDTETRGVLDTFADYVPPNHEG